MPSTPIILPIIVTGIVVGSLVKSKAGTFPKKKIAYASLVSGVLNSVYAYASYLMTPRPTFARAATVQQSPELVFTFSSFIAGVLVVLAVVGVAMIYTRLRGGQTIEEADVTTESESESESTPP